MNIIEKTQRFLATQNSKASIQFGGFDLIAALRELTGPNFCSPGRNKLVDAWESEAPFLAALVGTGITLDEIKAGREALCAEADDLERRARIARSIVKTVAAVPEPQPLKAVMLSGVAPISPEMFRHDRENAGFIYEQMLRHFGPLVKKEEGVAFRRPQA